MTTMMNLNLSQIRTLTLFAGLICLGFGAKAQSKSQLSYGISIHGAGAWAITNGTDYNNYVDTVKSSTTAHLNKGLHIWLNYSLGKKNDLQIGLGYVQTGFSRKQEDLNFSNYTFPGIGTGRIEDLSNTPKGITYNYRFNYLQVPIILNTYLGRSRDFKWVSNFSAGITPQFLLKHQLQANCIPGYSIEGESKFKLDSSGFTGNFFALSVQVGMNIEYKANKNKVYFFQPLIGFNPLSISKSPNTATPIFVGLNLGMKFSSFASAD